MIQHSCFTPAFFFCFILFWILSSDLPSRDREREVLREGRPSDLRTREDWRERPGLDMLSSLSVRSSFSPDTRPMLAQLETFSRSLLQPFFSGATGSFLT